MDKVSEITKNIDIKSLTSKADNKIRKQNEKTYTSKYQKGFWFDVIYRSIFI